MYCSFKRYKLKVLVSIARRENFETMCTAALTQRDHCQVTQCLTPLSNQELTNVGLRLGLRYPTLKKMGPESLLNDMVNAWLRRDDDVAEVAGEPSWESLTTALEDCGYNGIASDVKKKGSRTSAGGGRRERPANQPQPHGFNPRMEGGGYKGVASSGGGRSVGPPAVHPYGFNPRAGPLMSDPFGNEAVMSGIMPLPYGSIFGPPEPVHLSVTEPFADESLHVSTHLDLLYTALCKTVAPHWRTVAFHLPMDCFASPHIGERGEHPYTCFKQVLKLWLENDDKPPTKYKILEVLRLLNFSEEADELEKKFRAK